MTRSIVSCRSLMICNLICVLFSGRCRYDPNTNIRFVARTVGGRCSPLRVRDRNSWCALYWCGDWWCCPDGSRPVERRRLTRTRAAALALLFGLVGCAGVGVDGGKASRPATGTGVVPSPPSLAPPSTTTVDLGPLFDAFRAWTQGWTEQAPISVSRQVTTTTTGITRGTDKCAYASLIRSVWARDAEWAITIAWRESRCQAGARNANEQASGLFQIMLPMHRRLFSDVGCDPSQWADPTCNTKAAWLLYQRAGRQPWRL